MNKYSICHKSRTRNSYVYYICWINHHIFIWASISWIQHEFNMNSTWIQTFNVLVKISSVRAVSQLRHTTRTNHCTNRWILLTQNHTIYGRDREHLVALISLTLKIMILLIICFYQVHQRSFCYLFSNGLIQPPI